MLDQAKGRLQAFQTRLGAEGIDQAILTDEAIGAADLVVILTDHSDIDYERLVASAHRVFDTRNATAAVNENREKITKL